MIRIRNHTEIEAITFYLQKLPKPVQKFLEPVHFISNHDPAFIGFGENELLCDGRCLSETSHYSPEGAQIHFPKCDRRGTAVLLNNDAYDKLVLYHELGHGVHELIGENIIYSPNIIPLNDYANRSYGESFATAFQAWATPIMEVEIYGYHTAEELFNLDHEMYHFFDSFFGVRTPILG